MRLCHNVAALNIYKNYSKTLESQKVTLGRISSGYKVSSASDDPNVIAQSENMRMQIKGLQTAQENVQDGTSMLQVGEGAMSNMTDMMDRIKSLAVQGLNNTNNPQDKDVINNEISQIVSGIKDIAKNTDFNGVELLNDSKITGGNSQGSVMMQVGANFGESIEIPTYNMQNLQLKVNYSGSEGTGYFLLDLNDINFNAKDVSGGSGNTVSGLDLSNIKLYKTDNTTANLTAQEAAGAIISSNGGKDFGMLDLVDKVSLQVVAARSKYGAVENRFESEYTSTAEISDQIDSADSSIRDADIAKEVLDYSKDNVLVQSGISMMAQANKLPQDVLQILQNVKSR